MEQRAEKRRQLRNVDDLSIKQRKYETEHGQVNRDRGDEIKTIVILLVSSFMVSQVCRLFPSGQ